MRSCAFWGEKGGYAVSASSAGLNSPSTFYHLLLCPSLTARPTRTRVRFSRRRGNSTKRLSATPKPSTAAPTCRRFTCTSSAARRWKYSRQWVSSDEQGSLLIFAVIYSDARCLPDSYFSCLKPRPSLPSTFSPSYTRFLKVILSLWNRQ